MTQHSKRPMYAKHDFPYACFCPTVNYKVCLILAWCVELMLQTFRWCCCSANTVKMQCYWYSCSAIRFSFFLLCIEGAGASLIICATPARPVVRRFSAHALSRNLINSLTSCCINLHAAVCHYYTVLIKGGK